MAKGSQAKESTEAGTGNDFSDNVHPKLIINLKYYTETSTRLENTDLENYAGNTLPILLKHLEALKAIKKGL